ncbi:CheR family methyltransferase [Chlorogloeopsis sp. ULAP01]|uniref:CheR family methyltransferase n=1 Tax=Chlorogloeopsis sp. ULAP01 TaxID=3056483 RepID=UPI0025AAF0C8|nr:CheR family methyltransferase [Chlorogloeopsis sp. ULAP01]MDM9385569.1 CheR family methyltransferase [Chlorogloeopsis sp. ULAP01]
MTTSDENPDFEALLHYLKQNCGCDLTGNKRDSLMRRFQRRMQQLGIENYISYLQYLKADPQECTPLLNTVLINFSGFFRDRDAWDYLANQIIPQIITTKQPQERIRVWSAGCASGEEVYTLVMLLAEILGIEQYLQRVQMFATDVDKDALKQAWQGSYKNNEVAGIPSQLLSKYFEQTEQGYVFCSQLRRSIIFGRHNLAVDAPMSKIDLLVCRNVLIYFQRETQASIFVRFHFVLTDKGFLFLGNSESLTNQKQIFIPVSLKHRIFTKSKDQKLGLNEHLLLLPQTCDKKAVNPLDNYIHIWQKTFEISPLAQIVVDRSGSLLLVNERAFDLFRLQNNDIGAPVRDLEIGQVVNPLTLLRQLNHDRRPFSLKNIKWVTDNGTTYLDIHITPISYSSGKLLGTNLTFIDATQYMYLKGEVERLNSTLARVTQELQLTREMLHSKL